MSGQNFFFRNHNKYKTNSFEKLQGNNKIFKEYEDDDDDEDDLEYLEEIPYSSSSVDRSSVGSIPWADDAIKQNQMEWEKLEGMLSGVEPLPEDSELKAEILDWQKKFPQLLQIKTPSIKSTLKQSQSFESNRTIDEIADETLDGDDTLSNISQESLEAQETFDDFPPRKLLTNPILTFKDKKKGFANAYHRKTEARTPTSLEDVFNRQLRITSIPLQQRRIFSSNKAQKQTEKTYPEPRRLSTTSSLTSPGHGPTILLPNNVSQSQISNQPFPLRMPPILNVLESNHRRFRGFHVNKSFVQLTQVQQAKSAAERQPSYLIRPSWHMTNHANAVNYRYYNNRNSIILPALNKSQISNRSSNNQVTFANKKGQSETSSTFNSSSVSLGQNKYNSMPDRFPMSTVTPAPSGRSISAAVHRSDFNQFYIPSSASKYNVFK